MLPNASVCPQPLSNSLYSPGIASHPLFQGGGGGAQLGMSKIATQKNRKIAQHPQGNVSSVEYRPHKSCDQIIPRIIDFRAHRHHRRYITLHRGTRDSFCSTTSLSTLSRQGYRNKIRLLHVSLVFNVFHV